VVGLALVVVGQQRLQVREVAEGGQRRGIRHAGERLDVVDVDVGKGHLFGVRPIPRAHFDGDEVSGEAARAAHHLLSVRALRAAGHRKAAAGGAAQASPQVASWATLDANVAPTLVCADAASVARQTQAPKSAVLAD